MKKHLSKMLAFLCCIIYIASYTGRYNYSAALAEIISSGIFSKSRAGIIGTVYFTLYGSGQIIFGHIADRVSPYKLITVGLFGSAAANLLMSFSSTIPQMTVVWGLNGVCQAALWPGIFYMISNIMTQEYRNTACLIMSVGVPLGTIAAYFLAGAAIKVSWQSAFLYPAFIISLAGISFVIASSYFKKRLKPKEKEIKEQIKNSSSKAYRKALVMSGAAVMMIPVLLHGMLRDGINAWVPTMITETYTVSPSFSAFVSVILPVINLLGAYISMFIYKLTKQNEITTAFISLLCGIVPMTFLLFLRKTSLFSSTFMLAFSTTFITAFNHIIVTILPLKFARYNKAATLTGTLNSITYAGCALSNLLFGYTSENYGWNFTVAIWLVIFISGAVISAFVIKKWSNFNKERDR